MSNYPSVHGEHGHQKPVLSGLIVVLGMLVATAMLGVFYLAGTGGIPTDDRSARLPSPPDSWPEYYNSYFRIKHPPGSQVESVNRRQGKREARAGPSTRHWFRHELLHESLIRKQGNKLMTIRLFQLPDTTTRRQFYDNIRDDDHNSQQHSPWTIQTRDVSVAGIPALLVEQQLERNGEGPLSRISLSLVSNDRYFYSLSTVLMPNNQYQDQRDTFKQIFATLEPRSTNG